MTLKTFRHRQITLRKWGRKATNLLKTASHCIQKCRHYEASYVQHKVMLILNCLKRSCPRAQSRVLLWRSKGRGSWGHKPLHGAANSRWECQDYWKNHCYHCYFCRARYQLCSRLGHRVIPAAKQSRVKGKMLSPCVCDWLKITRLRI